MVAARVGWGSEEEDFESSGRTMVKTCLLEAHRGEEGDGAALGVLSEIGKRLGVTVGETDDPDLLRLRADDSDSWCDTSLGRYCRFAVNSPLKLPPASVPYQ